jgi:hypothetical protein
MKIQFSRSGGFAGIRLALTLDSSELSPKDRQELERLVREASFFKLPGSFLSPQPQPDAFQYQITVEDGGQSHRVLAGDRGAPKALRPLIERLEELARARAPSRGEGTPKASPERKKKLDDGGKGRRAGKA